MPAGNPQCWETLGGCNLLDNFLTGVFLPFDFQFAGWFQVIFWGTALFMIWLSTRNPLYATFAGILLATELVAIDPDVIAVGLAIATVVILTSLYQLFIVKTQNPTF